MTRLRYCCASALALALLSGPLAAQVSKPAATAPASGPAGRHLTKRRERELPEWDGGEKTTDADCTYLWPSGGHAHDGMTVPGMAWSGLH